MYDLVISLGERCATAMALKSSGITTKTYPFDWSAGILWDKCGNCGLLGKVNLICNNFKDAFCLEDFEEAYYEEPANRYVRNRRTGLQYAHDFPWEKTIKDYFPEFLAKYKRRVNRLYEDINKSNNILFVFITRENHNLPVEDIKLGYEKLSNKFPDKNIHFFIMQSTDDCNAEEVKRTELNNQITLAWYKDIKEGNGNHIQIKKAIFQECGYEYFPFTQTIYSLGLGARESFGRWTIGSDVIINITTEFKNKDLIAKFDLFPYLEGTRNWQDTTVYCNGTLLTEWYFTKEKNVNTSVEIPSKINTNGSLNFEFLIKDPISPQEATSGHSPDTRKIALAFNNITLKIKD